MKYYIQVRLDLKVDILESFGVLAYKVASADLTNMPLINKLSQTSKPIILLTGMSKLVRLRKLLIFLRKETQNL